MGRPWVWREYDEEGLRFTLLLAQHELRDLAVRLESLRARKGPPQSQTERILGQYHLAYRDLAGAERLEAYRETRSEEHTSELQSLTHLICRPLPEKTKDSPAT